MEFLQPFEAGRVLSRAPAVLRQNLGAFSLMALVAYLPQALLSYVLHTVKASEGQPFEAFSENLPKILGAAMLGAVLTPLAVAMVTHGVLQQLRGRSTTFAEYAPRSSTMTCGWPRKA
ncbi:hypothetical protein [Chondromyces apiculatus]|uniref:Uncharacterized protein n=1 Tax=Chondromyces apiculatus DSM 436 TaxID=1192034 RepID=A0A017T743_9BACT|nr:hypothetical protein [Chondromyces apiculatus]EYF04610.1 Hypothetical protein CAP_4286 [Chondromyces apiculatus DSM 436]